MTIEETLEAIAAIVANEPDADCITKAELKHQLYGAKVQRDIDLADHAKWIRENVGANVAVEFLKAME